MCEEATSKKFIVSFFNNYKMVDHKHVMEQFAKLERFLNHYNEHNLYIDEAIIECSIIDKLLSS